MVKGTRAPRGKVIRESGNRGHPAKNMNSGMPRAHQKLYKDKSLRVLFSEEELKMTTKGIRYLASFDGARELKERTPLGRLKKMQTTLVVGCKFSKDGGLKDLVSISWEGMRGKENGSLLWRR